MDLRLKEIKIAISVHKDELRIEIDEALKAYSLKELLSERSYLEQKLNSSN